MWYYNKIIAVLLMTIYLFSANPVKELLKLPLLAEHYYDHQEENQKANLLSFLIQHYFIENGTDKDANEDNKLPFKSAESISTITLVYLLPAYQCNSFLNSIQSKDIRFFIRNDIFSHAQFLATIWQPPRIADLF